MRIIRQWVPPVGLRGGCVGMCSRIVQQGLVKLAPAGYQHCHLSNRRLCWKQVARTVMVQSLLHCTMHGEHQHSASTAHVVALSASQAGNAIRLHLCPAHMALQLCSEHYALLPEGVKYGLCDAASWLCCSPQVTLHEAARASTRTTSCMPCHGHEGAT